MSKHEMVSELIKVKGEFAEGTLVRTILDEMAVNLELGHNDEVKKSIKLLEWFFNR